jgi:hypothetical protein
MSFRRETFFEMTEMALVPDIYIGGIGAIDLMDCNARFVLFAEQAPEEGGPMRRVVVSKLVGPTGLIVPTMKQIAAVVGHAAMERIGMPRSVHGWLS